jgi:hypothetical protein
MIVPSEDQVREPSVRELTTGGRDTSRVISRKVKTVMGDREVEDQSVRRLVPVLM